MSLLEVEPKVADAPPPEIEVLIKEARRRQRRRQACAAAALTAVAGLALAIGIGFSGGGGGRHARDGGGSGDAGGGGRAASNAAGGLPRVLASPLLPLSGYQLAASHGQVAVTVPPGWRQNGCETRLLDPRTLHVAAVDYGCNDRSTLPRQVVVDFRGVGAEIRVRIDDRSTGKRRLGPVLMTLAEWDWAHSGAVQGDGAIWIYGLESSNADSKLLEVSSTTGAVLHRFEVPAGADPFMAANADGFWITESSYGGSFCAKRCTLWHVAPGSGRLVAARTLGVGTQWLMASSDSIYADVLSYADGHAQARGGFVQTIWRIDGPGARVAYRAAATLLPSTDFAPSTGYFVIGNARQGYYTLSRLGHGRTPDGTGGCDTAAPIRLVRIDPATGAQSYVATLPRSDTGAGLDCHLSQYQATLYDGSVYLLTRAPTNLYEYSQVVRLPARMSQIGRSGQ